MNPKEPFGWKLVNGSLRPKKDEQEIISLIKELIDLGVSYNQIADYLKKEGIKTTGKRLKEIIKEGAK
jgi:DNA-binding transcriptional MerR regulator